MVSCCSVYSVFYLHMFEMSCFKMFALVGGKVGRRKSGSPDGSRRKTSGSPEGRRRSVQEYEKVSVFR
mgnify:CR=1 FL=1